jgi:hypothetical protein
VKGDLVGVVEERERDPRDTWFFESALGAFRVRVRLTLERKTS